MDWLKEWTKKLSLKKSFAIYLSIFLLIGILLAKVNAILISSYEIELINKQFDKVLEVKEGEENTYYTLKKLPESKLARLTYKLLLCYRNFAVEIHCLLFAILAFSTFYKHKVQNSIDYFNSYSSGDRDMTIALLDEENELSNACEKIESYTKDLHEQKIKVWRQYDAFNHMVSSIGHDIRTPLTILKGNQEMMRCFDEENSKYNDKRLEILDSMERQTARIEEYIEKISNLQSIDELTIKKNEISLKEFIFTLEQVGNGLCKNKRIHWIKSQKDRKILIDSVHIQEVFENIINNAIRYAKENIYVEFLINDKEFKIRVQDDGPGFSEDALSYATSPFFCENNVKGHMGLGLNISSIILEKHGGKLQISNAEYGGVVEIIIIL